MNEKQTIKISLGKIVCCFIMIVLIIAFGIVYTSNNKKIKNLEDQNNELSDTNDKLKDLLCERETNVTQSDNLFVEEDANSNNVHESQSKNNNESNTTSEKLSLIGEYSNKSETNTDYYSAQLIVLEETNFAINFQLSAMHGTDIDHVNIGEISGTAKKIGTNIYQFEEIIEGEINRITFKFITYRGFNYVTVSETYPSGNNPFGGHNVFFAGDYEKIS